MFTLQPLRFDFHSFRARLVGLLFALFALSGAMLAFIAPAAAQFAGSNDAEGAGAGVGGTVLHVAEVASLGGDGSSWAAAFTHPQQALDAAAGISGSVLIKVAQGSYVPTLRTSAADPRSVTFQLRNNTTLSGGYAGPGESDPDARNTSLYETILTGDINGDDAANFVNYEENAYHVLIGSGTDATAVLDGFTASGGNANVGVFPDFSSIGGGLLNFTGSPTIQACVIADNYGYNGGAIYNYDGSNPHISGCQFHKNLATNSGGAIRNFVNSSPVIEDCTFVQNSVNEGAGGAIGYRQSTSISVVDCVFVGNDAGAGGGIHVHNDGTPDYVTISRCTFVANTAVSAGALSTVSIVLTRILECSFIDNSADILGGAVIASPNIIFESSRFVNNQCGMFAGAAYVAGNASMINCIFSRNECPSNGAIHLTGRLTMSNCTIAQNLGYGVVTEGSSNPSVFGLAVENCTLWNNSEGSILSYSYSPDTPTTVSFSNIQGGWTGSGGNNIDEDPLFIQTSCDNLRLAHDSPCIDAGSNALIPAGITADLAGNPRIQNGIVDMGAYEGGHDILPPAACADYLAQGINVRLVPNGGAFSPLNNPAIVIRNEDDPNLGNALVMQHDFPLHPSGGGFNEIGSALQVTTSIPNGGFWMRVILPFTPTNLNGFNPEDVELTFFDEKDNEWKLAASANLANSPGHSGPLGDRLFTQGTTNQFGLSPDLGDYGVFWNPQLQQGFAWANVDHATDFAIGIRLPQCAGDCAYPGDGLVSPIDAQTVITAWGLAQNGPLSFADITEDGRVGTFDLLEVLNHWGPCP